MKTGKAGQKQNQQVMNKNSFQVLNAPGKSVTVLEVEANVGGRPTPPLGDG